MGKMSVNRERCKACGFCISSCPKKLLGFSKEPNSQGMYPVKPASLKSEKLSSHEGEESIFVLEGEMEAILGSHRDVLCAGDCIYYDSSIPHKVRCHRNVPAKILAMIWAPQT